MLIWKTQALDPTIASVRYRCIFPARALEQRGVASFVYGRRYPLPMHQNLKAIIFVKSFTDEDVQACQAAGRLGIPIILDLCDNIFIDNYGQGITQAYSPKTNFLIMAQWATAIVTTGLALKQVIEQHIEANCPVWVIPDGCETLADVEYALHVNIWQRWLTLLRNWPYFLLIELISYVTGITQRLVDRVINELRRVKNKLLDIFDIKHGPESAIDTWNQQSDNITQTRNGAIDLSPVSKLAFRDKSPGFALKVPNISTHNLTKRLNEAVGYSYNGQSLITEESQHQDNSLIVESNPGLIPQKQKGSSVKTIIWFGHHGSPYSQSGIVNISVLSKAIENISQIIPLRLLVVSNSYSKYLDLIAPLPFDTAYAEWHPTQIYQHISSSDLVILPNSKTPFAWSKSANRAVLSLSLGVPVVATFIPAMEPFRECMLFDNWENNLRQYLEQPGLVRDHLQKAQVVIKANYSGEAIATQWFNLIHSIYTEP